MWDPGPQACGLRRLTPSSGNILKSPFSCFCQFMVPAASAPGQQNSTVPLGTPVSPDLGWPFAPKPHFFDRPMKSNCPVLSCVRVRVCVHAWTRTRVHIYLFLYFLLSLENVIYLYLYTYIYMYKYKCVSISVYLLFSKMRTVS